MSKQTKAFPHIMCLLPNIHTQSHLVNPVSWPPHTHAAHPTKAYSHQTTFHTCIKRKNTPQIHVNQPRRWWRRHRAQGNLLGQKQKTEKHRKINRLIVPTPFSRSSDISVHTNIFWSYEYLCIASVLPSTSRTYTVIHRYYTRLVWVLLFFFFQVNRSCPILRR